MQIQEIRTRPDRLVEIRGERRDETIIEWSSDHGSTWRPATVYPGTCVDQWRSCEPAAWNRAVSSGTLDAGSGAFLWNYLFDLDVPAESVQLRARAASGNVVLQEESIDLGMADDVVVVDRRNVVDLCRGRLPAEWSLRSAVPDSVVSIHRVVELKEVPVEKEQPRAEIAHADLSPLRLGVGVRGWYRIYLGMEPYSACRFWLSRQGVWYEVPNWHVDSPNRNPNIKSGEGDRLKQEFFLCSADLTHQDICISAGGARLWRDVSIRYLKLVRMTADETRGFGEVRELARTSGRRFAGYMEPCTPATSEPEVSTMRDHIRNRVRQNALRGSDEVYMHAIRLGSRAWYHSDVVERLVEGPEDAANEHGWLNFMRWMRQGDPMAVAIEEAREAGLKLLTDMGMNSTYYDAHLHYGVLTDRFAREHPEYLCPERQGCFDYRLAPVRQYAAAVVRELLVTYDTAGINLDFARWGYRPAYDAESLVAMLEAVDRIRKEAEEKWEHPLIVSTRIPYDPPGSGDVGEPVFIGALRQWAARGLVDRFMVCLHDFGDNRVQESTSLRHYRDAARDSGVEFWLDMYQGTWFTGGGPARDLHIARSLVQQGVDGGVFYYMGCRPVEWESINWQMKLVDFPDAIVDPHCPLDLDQEADGAAPSVPAPS